MRMMLSSVCAGPASASISSIWPPAMPFMPEACASSKTRALRTSASAWVSPCGQNFKCQREQRVSRKYGRRLVKFLVRRGLAAPQVVIIHRRQIIMHQRIAMHAFERRPHPQGAGRGHIEQARRFNHQKWPQALSRPQRRIAHGAQQTRRCAFGQQLLQQGIRCRCRFS